MQNFSLIIPVFNEKENIIPLMDSIIEKDVYHYLKEIIFINDGSNDGSKIILEEISEKYNKIKLIDHKINKGQSHALLSGIKNSEFENIITIDSDGQNPPEEITKMIEKYSAYAHPILLSGIRIKRNDNLIKIISSKIANKVRNLVLNDDCPDTGCSLKIFRRDDFLSLPFFNGIHRFLPTLFMYKNIKVIYINVKHNKRLKGDSKYGTIDRLVKTIFDLFKVMSMKNKIQND